MQMTTAPPLASGRSATGRSSATRLREALAASSWDARWVAIAVLASLGVTAWWLTQDTRVADFYSAIQIRFVFITHGEIAGGQLAAPFTEFGNYIYPPLGRLVGALGTFVGGENTKAAMLALNVVFVPALAVGCYGVGRRLAGTRAGLLAALFALGAPMIVSESHEVYLDPLQAAMVALSVLGIIASRRFERVGVAALAGLATALAFLTKETTPIFLAGLIAVVLLRGGWRNWRGVIAYGVVVAVIAGPWYLDHFTRLHQLVHEAQTPPANPIAESTPAHTSVNNATWYFWDAANLQLRAALLLALLVGIIAAVRSAIRDRGPTNIYPELLGGLLVSYVGMTIITIKDPRYDLPALIYMAVIGTAWIPTIRIPVLRRGLTAGLIAAVAASFASVAFGLGGNGYTVRVAVGGSDAEKLPAEGFVSVYATTGWVAGPPERNDGNVLALMRGLRRDGVRAAAFCCGRERPEGEVDGGAERIDFNVSGLVVLAKEAGLRFDEQQGELRPTDVFVAAHAPIPGAPPCQRLRDGTGIYAILGDPVGRPFSRYTFICPSHTPAIYGYGAGSVHLPLRG
jgi:dolichyl-phosphate-mannose-protein mannosyltransferase